MAHNWIADLAEQRLAEIYGPDRHHRYSPRVARKRTAVTQAAAKVAALNGGERPSILNPLELRLKLRHKQTGIAVEVGDVTAVQSELRERMIEADIETIIEYLEDYGDPVRALAAIVEESAGYYEETRVRH